MSRNEPKVPMTDDTPLRIAESAQETPIELAYRNASVLSRAKRELVGRLHQAPGFLVIGAQKSGTTSLHDLLVQHPSIAGANKKEVHFFDWRYGRGSAWYRAQFPYRRLGANGIAGEASPYYLFHPRCAERIAACFPRMKLVAVLREPAARALSHYHHAVRHGYEDRSLSEAIHQEQDMVAREERKLTAAPDYRSIEHRERSYVSRGLYADQLDRYRQHFPASNLLVLNSRELFETPAACVRKCYTFLGVDADYAPPALTPKNQGSYTISDKEEADVMAWLRDYYREPNIRLEAEYGISFDA